MAMKNIFTLLSLLIILNSYAQRSPFVRLYNIEGHKFKKGHLERITDSGLVFKTLGQSSGEISYKDIYKIRLRKSPGMTALIVGGIPILWGASLINRNQNWDGLVGVLIIIEGMVIGPTAGGIKALLNPRPININGNLENWEKAKSVLRKKLE